MSEEQEKTAPEPSPPSAFASRRQFIQFGLAAVGAAWLGTLVQSRFFPAQSGIQEAKPVEFPLAELPVGGTKAITYAGSPTLVLRTPESIRAFSLICTHLGCLVEWRANEKEFYCPCHDGLYDEFGEVLSGPPPVPLEQIQVKVDGEKVIVGETV
jgi:cytochrome b6-f complex iron-sulfur subunit